VRSTLTEGTAAALDGAFAGADFDVDESAEAAGAG
jgi:hypothetical protein